MIEVLNLDRARLCSLTEQVFVAIRDAISAGKIRPGARLPATRELAREAGIGRNTVLNAYDELRRQGVIASRRGSGNFVASPGSWIHPKPAQRAASPSPFLSHRAEDPKVVEVSWNKNPPMRAWSRAMRSSVRVVSHSVPDAREVLSQYLAVRGIDCSPDHVFVTANTRQALDLSLRSMSVMQREILLEDPGSTMTQTLALLTRMKPVALPVDSSGANIAAALRTSPSPLAAYVSPAHQNPLGVVMTAERREALLLWAELGNGWIIEDDTAATLRRPQETPLYSRSGRVLHIGTLAYPLAPLSVLSYVVAPDLLVPRIAALSAALGVAPSSCEQFAVAQLLLSRTYQRGLDALRSAAEQRHRAIARACARELLWFVARAGGSETGERAVLWLQQSYDAHAVVRVLRGRGMATDPLQELALMPVRDAIVVHFDSVRTEEIDGVVRQIANLVRDSQAGCLREEAPLYRTAVRS